MTQPRWHKCLEKALADNPKAVLIQLATASAAADATNQTTVPVPHVRCHIFRSFIVPPRSPNLPLVLTTTDVRTPKITQMIANPRVELVWWIEGAQEQYRISGTTTIIPDPTHTFYNNFVHSLSHGSPTSALRALIEQNNGNLDWEAKRLEIFRTMSPYMKATWARPEAPGAVLTTDPSTWPERVDEPTDGDSEKEKENRKNWDIAFSNFALVLIEPREVDYLDMSVRPNQRYRFWKKKDTWEEQAIVP